MTWGAPGNSRPLVGLPLDWHAVRIESCLCGGFLKADPLCYPEVAKVVRAHQQTLGHQAWFARSGWGK